MIFFFLSSLVVEMEVMKEGKRLLSSLSSSLFSLILDAVLLSGLKWLGANLLLQKRKYIFRKFTPNKRKAEKNEPNQHKCQAANVIPLLPVISFCVKKEREGWRKRMRCFGSIWLQERESHVENNRKRHLCEPESFDSITLSLKEKMRESSLSSRNRDPLSLNDRNWRRICRFLSFSFTIMTWSTFRQTTSSLNYHPQAWE